MPSHASTESNGDLVGLGRVLNENSDSLDVGWLLHSKKEPSRGPNIATLQIETNKRPAENSNAEPTPPQTPVVISDASPVAEASSESNKDGKSATINGEEVAIQNQAPNPPAVTAPGPSASAVNSTPSATPTASPSPRYHLKRPHLLTRISQQDENKTPSQNSPQGSVSPKQTARRGSWILNLGSRFSSPGAASPMRSSVDAEGISPNEPLGSPVALNNSSKNAQGTTEVQSQLQKGEDKPVLGPPRRPSVLVQAGRERDDHTSFLQSALRRFSSANSNFGKGTGRGQAAQRKVLNVDQNRARVKVAELEPSSLRRVAFCVDVEVAGYASWHEVEEFEAERRERREREAVDNPVARRQSLSMLDRQVQNVKGKREKKGGKKGVKEAKTKDETEEAALKNSQEVEARKEDKESSHEGNALVAQTPTELPLVVIASEDNDSSPMPLETPSSDSQPVPGTRKREKKKKSEVERKERKEKKRRQAEADGEVPLEINGCSNDIDDCSSGSQSPTNPSSPTLTASPTTDPLRIYKRCAQLRETNIVQQVRRQIASPSSTLAEQPGTVAVLDLSGTVMSLPELATLSDWLAVVPVRKILLEDCQLNDEGVRVVLSGLLGCKTVEQARRNRRLPKIGRSEGGEEQMGVVEKISLKGNSKLTRVGWKHIALFLHTSTSLKAIDLSGIPFPSDRDSGTMRGARTANAATNRGEQPRRQSTRSLGPLFSKALAERLRRDTLEELLMSTCALSSDDVADIADAASKCGLRRLGLAGNNITAERVESLVTYIESGICEGLDLSENDLHDCMKPLSKSLTSASDFSVLSLSDCNLSPSDLKVLVPSLVQLKKLRFLDLSSNRRLFSSQPNVVCLLRKHLPQMTSLKRIHLNDVGLSSEHAIALAEILPECTSLAHLSILNNSPITELMHSKEAVAQEEACALFASLMTAVRVSRSIVAMDIEVPSSDSNDILQALASQVVAYTLRNLEHGALKELEGRPTLNCDPSKNAPEILLHLVGNMEGHEEDDNADEATPGDDYLMGGNAIVKALAICLGTEEKSGASSRNITPSATPADSQPSTPRLGAVGPKPASRKKPRDMSKQLLESARKIKTRLQPALVREDRAGNDFNYRRLQFLDSTLQRMIQRFEDEYPECRLPSPISGSETLGSSDPELELHHSSLAEASVLSDSGSEAIDNADAEDDRLGFGSSRTGSSTWTASRALAHEEGRMHRYTQSVRREIALQADHGDSLPTLSEAAHTDATTPPSASSLQPAAVICSEANNNRAQEASRLSALQHRLDNMCGDEMAEFGQHCHRDGVDKALTDVLGVTTQELLEIARSDPEAFATFRQSQVAARINAEIE